MIRSLPAAMRASTVIEPGLEDERGAHDRQGNSGPRIRCPLCAWPPRPDTLWSCTCRHAWNTFDTGGVCPSCLHQWTSTQCPSCGGWSAHSSWY